MSHRGKGGGAKSRKKDARERIAPAADQKFVMSTVYLTPEDKSLLDEICYYIGRNSRGSFRPSRSEILRLLVDRLRAAKRNLKQARTIEELEKAIKVM